MNKGTAERKDRSLTAFEYRYWVEEVKDRLIGQRFRKFSEIEKDRFLIRFDRDTIRIGLPNYVCITRYIEEAKPSPSGFVMAIRKRLKGQRIRGVEQVGTDRILRFMFDNYSLVVELFSHGNILLLDTDGTLIVTYKREIWKDRRLIPREKYIPPKNKQYPFKPSPEQIREILSNRFVVVDMSVLPIGTVYVKEVLRRCDIDEKMQGIKLSAQQIECILSNIDDIITSAAPWADLDENKNVVDFALTKRSEWNNPVKCDSFNRLIDEYYRPPELTVPTEDKRLTKLRIRLAKQVEHLERLKQQEEEYRKMGDYIYLHYAELDELLTAVREGKDINRKGVKIDRRRGVIEIDTEEFES